MSSHDIVRMNALKARAEDKAGRPLDTSEVAEVLWPRLHRSLKWVAIASSGETGAFLRDVIYLGADEVAGGEVFSHAGVTPRKWIASARTFPRRVARADDFWASLTTGGMKEAEKSTMTVNDAINWASSGGKTPAEQIVSLEWLRDSGMAAPFDITTLNRAAAQVKNRVFGKTSLTATPSTLIPSMVECQAPASGLSGTFLVPAEQFDEPGFRLTPASFPVLTAPSAIRADAFDGFEVHPISVLDENGAVRFSPHWKSIPEGWAEEPLFLARGERSDATAYWSVFGHFKKGSGGGLESLADCPSAGQAEALAWQLGEMVGVESAQTVKG